MLYERPNRPTHKPLALLIEAACSKHEADLVEKAFSPQRPSLGGLTRLDAIDPTTLDREESARFLQIEKALAAFRQSLTHTAGPLADWLEASDEDIRELAMRYAARRMPSTQKLGWAAKRLGMPIPGVCLESQLARLNSARFWRRAIRTVLRREREQLFLRLKLIGLKGEHYVSGAQLLTRQAQLLRQKAWMEETVLVAKDCKPGQEGTPVSLASVASDPYKRFAKLYTFTKAMEALAHEHQLVSALVTLTAAPEYHPNPSHGECSWNDSSPKHTHQAIARGWNAVQVELYKRGVGISGLRVVEPHKDGCPHWHVWLLYRPEVETDILAALLRQFPSKLKLRAPSPRGRSDPANDRIFVSREDVLAGAGRALSSPKEGAQVEFSKIDPSISSGASYAMKYLLKTVDGGEALTEEVDVFGERSACDAEPDSDEAAKARWEAKKKRLKHAYTVKRVDAWRNLWSINSAMLFGVARCLGAWDELRRLAAAPDNPTLFRLWVLARGSDKPGRVVAGSGQRGDAKAFLEALGGITAARDPRDKSLVPSLRLARLTETGENVYGEPIKRPKGVQLIKTVPCKERVPGKRPNRMRTIKSTLQLVVATVVTRLIEWRFMRSSSAKSAAPDQVNPLADGPYNYIVAQKRWVKREVVPIALPKPEPWQMPLPELI